jgi:O-antigen ligase
MGPTKNKLVLSRPVKWIFGSLISVTLYFQINLVDPFNSPKFWILMLVGSWFLGDLWVDRNLIKNNAVIKTLFYLILIFIFGALLSTIFADFYERAIFGEVMRKNGFLTYFALAIITLVAAINVRIAHLGSLIRVTFFILLIVVSYGLIQTSGNDFVDWNNPYNSVIATVGNPNFAAAIMAIMGVLVFSSIFISDFGKNYKLAAILLSLVCIFTIYRSNARQGLLSYAIGVGFFLIVVFWTKSKRIGVIGLALGAVLTVISILGMLQIGPLEKYLYKGSVSVRGYYWRAGFEMLKENPLVGVGMDSYGSYFKEFREVNYPLSYGFEITSSNAHNTFVQFFATGGLILGTAYLILNLFVLRRAFVAIKSQIGVNRVAISGVVAGWISFHAQSFVSIDNVGISIWGWVLAGVIIGVSIRNDEEASLNLQISNQSKSTIEIGRTLISGLATLVSIVVIALLYRTEINTYKLMSSFESQNMQAQQDYKNLNLENFNAQLINSSYRLTSALNLANLGLVEESLSGLKKILDSDARNLDVLNSLAQIYEQSGRVPEAIDIRIKISELDPWNAKNYLELGKNYKLQGDQTRVEEILGKILSFAATNPVGIQARSELGS